MGCTGVGRTTHSQVPNVPNVTLVAPQCDKKKSEFLCRTCPIDSFKLSGTLLESRCGKALSSMYYSRGVVEQFTSCIELW